LAQDLTSQELLERDPLTGLIDRQSAQRSRVHEVVEPDAAQADRAIDLAADRGLESGGRERCPTGQEIILQSAEQAAPSASEQHVLEPPDQDLRPGQKRQLAGELERGRVERTADRLSEVGSGLGRRRSVGEHMRDLTVDEVPQVLARASNLLPVSRQDQSLGSNLLRQERMGGVQDNPALQFGLFEHRAKLGRSLFPCCHDRFLRVVNRHGGS